MPPDARIPVLHVITRLVVGGAQENTLLTVERLARDRYAVTLASGPTSGPEGTLEHGLPPGVPFIRIPELVRDLHPILDVRALCRLYALMRRGRYKIVHTHTTKAGLLGRVAARLARVPIVVHTPHGHAFHDYLNATGSTALIQVERWLTGFTDRVLCLTEAERQDHLRLRIGPAEKFDVVHSGIDIERFRQAGTPVPRETARAALGLPADGFVVGCVARLAPVKGVQHLLEAVPAVLAAVQKATFIIVGDGPLRAQLERRACALGIDGGVRFLGLRRDIPDLMSLCDVMVLPSLNEGMGRAAVEALAAGRPVIGSRVSGIQDIVADEETGLLVPPADPRALADAIVRCCADRALLSAMGQRAGRGVERFGIVPMIADIDSLYVRLLNERTGGRAVNDGHAASPKGGECA
ncbi:MAG TPA: glycosyltransferase family 4 protein [bacterium]|nr:glycosyltransferase family 4 protein [bacterium]